MNADYKKVQVTIFHNGQHRLVNLEIVTPENQTPIHFLTDFFGWAICDHKTIESAVAEYVFGRYITVIK
jgi:hypothetical protein